MLIGAGGSPLDADQYLGGAANESWLRERSIPMLWDASLPV